jgi:hypothetical protein
MADYTRAHQLAGDFTALEISQKAHNDAATAYYEQQLSLIADQRKYTATIRCSSIVTAVATAVMAITLIVQVFVR